MLRPALQDASRPRGHSHFLPHHNQSRTVRPTIRTTTIMMTALLEDVSDELVPDGGEVRSSVGLG